MTDELTVINGIGSNEEYYGSDDPRWSQPQPLAVSYSNQVVPLSDLSLLGVKAPPATWDQIFGRDTKVSRYPLESYQRLLQGRKDTAGPPMYWVVNAVFRMPPTDSMAARELHDLPAEIRLTQEEMEVLGPWLGLSPIPVKTGSPIYQLFDLGPDPLDQNLLDGVDHIFKTAYNWDNPGDVKALFLKLRNFKQIHDGQIPNPKEKWPVDFDSRRLECLVEIVNARSKYLEKREKRGTEYLWEEMIDRPGSTTAVTLGVASGMVFAGGAFQGGWRNGFEFLLKPLAPLGRGALSLHPYAVHGGRAFLSGITGSSALSRLSGAALAVTAGDFLGGMVTDAWMRKMGVDQDPDYRLMRYAYDQMTEEFAGKPLAFVFGNVIHGMQGLASLYSDDFDRLLAEGLDRKTAELISLSRAFGAQMTDDLLHYALESRDTQDQIDARVLRAKVRDLYRRKQKEVARQYDLLAYTGHRAPQARTIKELIAPDGTIRDFGLLKDHLKKRVEKREQNLFRGGGLALEAAVTARKTRSVLQQGIGPQMSIQAGGIGIETVEPTSAAPQKTKPRTTQRPFMRSMGGMGRLQPRSGIGNSLFTRVR